MPSPLCQQLRKGTFALSTLVFFFVLQQLCARFSMPSQFSMSVRSTLVRTQVDLQNHTSLEDFPKRIWTTGPLSPMRIKKEDANHVRTWMDQNPEYRYELLTDAGAETYVKDHFLEDSKISGTYLSLSDYIMRADLIRYLALLKDGGVYSDLDVGCLRPIDLWIPPAFKNNTSVVLGIEVDNEMGPNKTKLFELVNWTIMSRRNAPFMRFLVDRVIDNLEKTAAKHNTTLFSLQPKRQEVIDVTGPAALTEAAFQYLSEKTQTAINMRNFTKMRRPKLVADILVLPINAFGAGHQVQWSGTDEDGSALVHHYFAGSWKTDHFDGPTEEEKKAEEAKSKGEEDRKIKEEDRKIKEEHEKQKEEEDRKVKEEYVKKKAEVERKRKEAKDKKEEAQEEERSRKEAEANKKQIPTETQLSEQGRIVDQGQEQREQQDRQEQNSAEKQEGGQEEQQQSGQEEQSGQDRHAGKLQEEEQNAETVKVEENVNNPILEQEKQRAIEEGTPKKEEGMRRTRRVGPKHRLMDAPGFISNFMGSLLLDPAKQSIVFVAICSYGGIMEKDIDHGRCTRGPSVQEHHKKLNIIFRSLTILVDSSSSPTNQHLTHGYEYWTGKHKAEH
ncbi:MAG: hypothetical protein Q9172_005105 [Xanthocarpia lactea]